MEASNLTVSRARAKSFRATVADFAKGHACKHVLAVRLHRKDAELLPLVERISSNVSVGELDLFHLWFDGGKQ